MSTSPTSSPTGDSPVGDLGKVERIFLGSYLLVLLLALAYALACVWPIAIRQTPELVRFRIFFTNIGFLNPDLALFWAVALLGALGGGLHAAGSFTVYTGNRTFVRSWVWWYLARAPIGLALAVVLYFVVRGGLVSVVPGGAAPGGTGGVAAGPSGTATLNPYGLAALGALAGLCSEIATQKLREVFAVLFRPDEKKKDPVTGSLHLTSISPSTVAVGAPDTEIALGGSDFKAGDEVVVDGLALPTTLSSPSELRATLPKAKLAQKGRLQILVRRGGPAGVHSDPVTLEVTQP